MKTISGFVEIKDRHIQIGKTPKFLLMDRFHGNEKEPGEIVGEYIDGHISELTSQLYIPGASPSATELQTRNNANNLDLNRNFFNDSPDSEIQFMVELLSKYKFETAISFHEDPEFTSFYIYDAFGPNLEGTETLQKIREEITALGVGLLSGVDAPNDPTLGSTFVNGYKYFPVDESSIQNPNGFFADWAYSNGIIKRYLNPEIPGKLDPETKKKIVEILFKYLVLNQ